MYCTAVYCMIVLGELRGGMQSEHFSPADRIVAYNVQQSSRGYAAAAAIVTYSTQRQPSQED